jgi:hypothetical protein
MNFSDLGFIYLEPGNTVEVSFWWGEGDDHGAVFALARSKAIESGVLPLNEPPPSFQYTTSNYRDTLSFGLDVSSDTQQLTDPQHVYGITVTNTGSNPGYFRLDGMTSA